MNSSSSNKTIIIDESLFGRQRKPTRQTKSNANLAIKPYTLRARNVGNNPEQKQRDRLIKYMMKRQEQNFRKQTKPPVLTLSEGENSSQSELDQSLDYLLELSEKVHEEEEQQQQQQINQNQPKNNTLKTYIHPPSSSTFNTDPNVSIVYPSEFETSSDGNIENSISIHHPKYGCLKNGSLPTYRQYKNNITQKMYPTSYNPPTQSSSSLFKPPESSITSFPVFTTPESQFQDANKDSISDNNMNYNNQEFVYTNKPSLPPSPTQQRKIIRRTFRIGKHKHRPEVTVLLPNRTIRRNVNNKKDELKHTSINDVKKFLIKRGLMKAGSTAPNEMLHQTYINAQLTPGEVHNHNAQTLIHNFFYEK